MDSVNEKGIHTVVVMSSAQVGKSEILLNVMGYFMDQDPAPMLMLQPTLSMAESFSKDRVAPMISATPALTALVKDPKARDSSNTLLHKKFPGGHVTLCGANSPSSLASRPISKILGDEVSRYPVSAGTEGDPLQLAIKRTATFHNRLIFLTSTPGVKDACRIEMAYKTSDQRHFHVACPHCGTMQPLVWEGIKYTTDDTGEWDKSDPWYECDGCGERIEEHHKTVMLRNGRWISENYSPGIAGFHINELYSPWRKWSDIMVDYVEALKDTELMRVWVNTSQGLPYEDAGDGVEATGLEARKEEYKAEVPMRAVCLVAGVDTQDDRLEVTVVGVGPKDERWIIEHRVLWGDPGSSSVWSMLDEVIIDGEYKHESGARLRVAATCIDSGGHYTRSVYEYCRKRKSKRVFPIKGVGGFGRAAVSAPSKRRSGRDRVSIDLWTLGVDEIKTTIYSRLGVKKPGPGYVHFSNSEDFGTEYFKQLAAEKMVTRFRRGIPYREWIQVRKRNEALDCMVYAWAAAILLNPRIEALAKRLREEKEDTSKAEAQADLSPRTNNRKPRSKARGGFVNGWK